MWFTLKLTPDNPTSYETLIYLLEQEECFVEALAHAKTVLRLYSDWTPSTRAVLANFPSLQKCMREGYDFVGAAEKEVERLSRLVRKAERTVARLVDLGYPREEAAAVVALVEQFELDLADVVHRVAEQGVGLIEAAGELLTARALGLLPSEFDALGGLEEHFAVFDNATGGRTDGRVSAGDLRFVVDHPWRFTSGQVAAAEALLAAPSLRNRLDTADENDEILDATWFGRTEPGDGLIAEADLRAFLLKAQLNHLLGPYADRIDIAADSSGVVDGYFSQNDFRRFLADNPELPESVVAAAEVMLANGWFDESWWQAHKDELALGAAVLAGGIVVIGTGGAASVVLVAGAGALAAGGTTIAVNLATGDELLDDVLRNGFSGLFVGAGVHAAVAGAGAYGTASTALARSAALAGATAGATDVVALGGVDLLIPEGDEARVHEVAGKVNWVAGSWEMTYASVDGWITTRMARFETLDEQLDALSPTISRQRQGRHIEGTAAHRQNGGGYFADPADAQTVLDAVHDGSGEILGRTRGGDILVRVEGVEGFHRNVRQDVFGEPTNVFFVKGTASPSVVPTRPMRIPE